MNNSTSNTAINTSIANTNPCPLKTKQETLKAILDKDLEIIPIKFSYFFDYTLLLKSGILNLFSFEEFKLILETYYLNENNEEGLDNIHFIMSNINTYLKFELTRYNIILEQPIELDDCKWNLPLITCLSISQRKDLFNQITSLNESSNQISYAALKVFMSFSLEWNYKNIKLLFYESEHSIAKGESQSYNPIFFDKLLKIGYIHSLCAYYFIFQDRFNQKLTDLVKTESINRSYYEDQLVKRYSGSNLYKPNDWSLPNFRNASDIIEDKSYFYTTLKW